VPPLELDELPPLDDELEPPLLLLELLELLEPAS
jgi:hypothetical protein